MNNNTVVLTGRVNEIIENQFDRTYPRLWLEYAFGEETEDGFQCTYIEVGFDPVFLGQFAVNSKLNIVGTLAGRGSDGNMILADHIKVLHK